MRLRADVLRGRGEKAVKPVKQPQRLPGISRFHFLFFFYTASSNAATLFDRCPVVFNAACVVNLNKKTSLLWFGLPAPWKRALSRGKTSPPDNVHGEAMHVVFPSQNSLRGGGRGSGRKMRATSPARTR